jgi:hypothetical protein
MKEKMPSALDDIDFLAAKSEIHRQTSFAGNAAMSMTETGTQAGDFDRYRILPGPSVAGRWLWQ